MVENARKQRIALSLQDGNFELARALGLDRDPSLGALPDAAIAPPSAYPAAAAPNDLAMLQSEAGQCSAQLSKPVAPSLPMPPGLPHLQVLSRQEEDPWAKEQPWRRRSPQPRRRSSPIEPQTKRAVDASAESVVQSPIQSPAAAEPEEPEVTGGREEAAVTSQEHTLYEVQSSMHWAKSMPEGFPFFDIRARPRPSSGRTPIRHPQVLSPSQAQEKLFVPASPLWVEQAAASSAGYPCSEDTQLDRREAAVAKTEAEVSAEATATAARQHSARAQGPLTDPSSPAVNQSMLSQPMIELRWAQPAVPAEEAGTCLANAVVAMEEAVRAVVARRRTLGAPDPARQRVQKTGPWSRGFNARASASQPGILAFRAKPQRAPLLLRRSTRCDSSLRGGEHGRMGSG